MENQALQEIQQAATAEDLEVVSIRYLGRKGLLTAFLRSISSLPEEQRPVAGKNANLLKIKLEKAIARFDIDNQSSYMIGDSERDIKAAEKVGLKTIKIEPNENIEKYINKIIT